jgi:hypothetical protein
MIKGDNKPHIFYKDGDWHCLCRSTHQRMHMIMAFDFVRRRSTKTFRIPNYFASPSAQAARH